MRSDSEQSLAELPAVLAVRQRWLVISQDVDDTKRLVLHKDVSDSDLDRLFSLITAFAQKQ